MQSYEMSSPFWYSEIPKDSAEKSLPSPPPGKTPEGRLSPFENIEDLMIDINRGLNFMKIKNKTYFELRMEDLQFSENQKKIASLSDDEVEKLDVPAMLKMLQQEETFKKEVQDEADVRKCFIEYARGLRDKIMFKKSPDEKNEANSFEGLGFSENEKKIVLLTANEISSLDRQSMLLLLGGDEKSEESDEAIRGRLKKYSNKLREKVNFKDFKDFLKKHLLSNIQEPNRQDYLAHVIASNSALSGGIVHAASSFFTTRQSSFVVAQNFYADRLTTPFDTLGIPETELTISCDDQGVVKLHSKVQFYEFGISGNNVSRLDNTPLVTIENTCSISALPSVNPSPQDSKEKQTTAFTLDFQSSPMKVERRVIPFKNGRKNIHVNQLLSKVFGDDPLSGSAGVYLQKNEPTLADCKPNEMHIYVEHKRKFFKDTYTLKYYALNKEGNRLITGKVPTGIKNIELNREARKYLASIAQVQPQKLEDLYKNPTPNIEFALERVQLGKEPVKESPQVLQTLAVAVSTIEYTPPKAKTSRLSLFGRSTQTTESELTQKTKKSQVGSAKSR